MKTQQLLTLALALSALQPLSAQERNYADRALWGSIAVDPSSGAINTGDYKKDNNKVLLTWRMLPGDDENTDFDLYRSIGNGSESRLNGIFVRKELKATCYQHDPLSTVSGDVHYRLTYAGDTTTIGRYTMTKAQATAKEPFIKIPLQPTEDVYDGGDMEYQANDVNVGDLDGDGQMEIVVKRLLGKKGVLDSGTGAEDTDPRARHTVIFDAYKLDGTLMWRVKSGPNIIQGNSVNFAVADLDGDGCCEVVTKTGEGTVFGDGYEIPDTDGDGKTDYRSVWPVGHYTGDGPKGYGGPEFFSVIDGKTGRELARADFICRGKEGEPPEELAKNWYENDWKWDPRSNKYQWKLANSLRLGVAEFTGKGMQIFLGRGVYGRTIVEGWQYEPTPSGEFAGTLTRLWKVDTDEAGGADKNKDGKPNSAYAGQGNHAFNVADLDGDGLDEVMYGSCAWDHDGTGLWTSGLGHGDANHVGQFLPDREGLQVFHCLESGKTMVALHDAKDGSVIWSKTDTKDNDMGRCMVDDIDPNSPGCEFWWYGSNAYDTAGTKDMGYKPSSCNMAIWFDGGLTRQLINAPSNGGGTISNEQKGRVFTVYRYDTRFINGSKANPSWYGDMLGDWREEFIVPDGTLVDHLKLFSTWYPTTHRIPWLMTDHTYKMQAIHEQVGYNQPTHTGYYLGSDRKSDAEIWAAAAKVEADRLAARGETPNAIRTATAVKTDNGWYNLMGQKVDTPAKGGVYVHNGKKVLVK